MKKFDWLTGGHVWYLAKKLLDSNKLNIKGNFKGDNILFNSQNQNPLQLISMKQEYQYKYEYLQTVILKKFSFCWSLFTTIVSVNFVHSKQFINIASCCL